MTPTFLSPAELHDRLVAAGQPLEEDDSGGLSTVVEQTPETIISVALNLDPTLMPAYRGRFFACLLRSEEDRTPALRDDPAFALPERFQRIDEGRASIFGFLDGPFRWLLPRLIAAREILVWPDDYTGSFARKVLSNASTGLRRLLPIDLTTTGAVVLDLERDEDRRVLWEVAARVADGVDNVFVSDPACAEVALLHHHDEVRLSIPDEARRRAVLDALSDCPSLEDCSGYTSSWDEEGVS
jgi:hypothetical protein